MKRLFISFLLLPVFLFANPAMFNTRMEAASGFNYTSPGVFSGIFSQANHSGSLTNPARNAFYDSSDAVYYPHLSVEHGHQIQAYYAGDDRFRGFGVVEVMDGLAIGFADYKANRTLSGLPAEQLSAHTYSLFAGYGMGNMAFGIAFDIWGSQNNQEDEVNTDPSSSAKDPWMDSDIFDIKLSMGMDLGNSSGFDLMLAFTFGMYTYETYNSLDTDVSTRLQGESDGIFALTIGGRYYMNPMDGVKVTAWGFIDYGSEGVKTVGYDALDGFSKVNPQLDEISGMMINFGASVELTTLNKKMMIRPFLGILYGSNTTLTESLRDPDKGSTNETVNTLTALPYGGISLEYALFDWFTLYSGYSKVVGSNTVENSIKAYANTDTNSTVVADTKSTTVNDYSVSGFTVGFSVHNEDMALVANLNTDFLLNGPDFISGTATNNMMATVTFEYKFDLPFGKQHKASKSAPKRMKEVKKAVEVKKEPVASDDDIE